MNMKVNYYVNVCVCKHVCVLCMCACVRVCACVCVYEVTERERSKVINVLVTLNNLLIYRGDSITVQAGKVSASAWMDHKTVMVMSTNCQPSSRGTVKRNQRDATSIEVPCPASIISYNSFMGGVDRGDQLRGYYRCRSKSRKFYKCIFFFLFDVAITNAYILLKSSGSCPFKDLKSFRLHLGKDLIGEYCSRRRRGRGGTIIHILPFRHYPMKLNGNGSRHPRGHCSSP